MELRLYKNFIKRKNSTLQPSSTPTIYTEFYTKDGCSIENPVFVIEGIDLTVNYAYWAGAYYFVDDIILNKNNIYELHCSMDVLATWRNRIAATYTYIERAASAYDEMINDSMLSATQEIVYTNVARTRLGMFTSTTGCFILEIMNKEGIQLVACESLDPFGIIFQPSTYTVSDIGQWIESKISQAFDLDIYIGTVKWVPFSASSLGEFTNYISIGPIEIQDFTNGFYIVNQEFYYRSQYIEVIIPHAYYNDFRDCNPRFTQYKAYFPGIGIVTLDSALIGTAAIHESRSLSVNINVDLVSGDIAYDLMIGQYITPVYHLEGNVSVNVPIGKSVSDISKTVSSLISGAASAATAAYAGNYAGAVVGAANTGIAVADNILSPDVQIMGGSGGNKGLLLEDTGIKISTIAYGTKQFPALVAGRPLCEVRRIGDLSGYIKCGQASIMVEGMGKEKDQINNYLNTGFYFE